MWVWQNSFSDAFTFLKAIQPFVRNKRDQVDLAIEFQSYVKPGYRILSRAEWEWREAAKVLMHEMKREIVAPPERFLDTLERRVGLPPGRQLELKLHYD